MSDSSVPPSPGFLIKRRSRDAVRSQRRRSLLHQFPHSLPSALNDPRKGRQVDLFTRDWGDSFVPTRTKITFPHTKREFHPQTKASRKHHVASTTAPSSVASSPGIPRPTFSEDDSEAEAPLRKPRLPDVPSMFLNAEFDLRDKDTFDAVILGGTQRTRDLRANTRLRQEKLSNHLDSVEMQLSIELAQRAQRIFAAMSSHEELGEKVAVASRAVHQFRTRLDATKQHVKHAYIRMLRLLIQRQNYSNVLATLSTVATVSRTQSTIQYMLASGEYNKALDLIQTTQEVVATDLKGVHAVRHLAHQLAEIKTLIAKMVDGDLVQVLVDAVKSVVPPLFAGESEGTHDGAVPSLTPLPPEYNNDNEDEGEEDEEGARVDALLQTIRPLVGAIARQQQSQVLATYETQLLTFLRGLVKDLVVDFLRCCPEKAVRKTVDPTQIASWGDSLRLLSFDSWMVLLDRTTCVFLRILRHIVCNHDALAIALRELSPQPFSMPPSGPPSPTKTRTDSSGSGGGDGDGNHGDSCGGGGGGGGGGDDDDDDHAQPAVSHEKSDSATAEGGDGSSNGGDGGGHGDDDEFDDEFVSDTLANTMDATMAELVDVDVQRKSGSRSKRASGQQHSSNGGGNGGGGGDSRTQARRSRQDSTGRGDNDGDSNGNGDSGGSGGGAVLSGAQYDRLVEANRRIVRRAVEEIHTRLAKVFQARLRDGIDAKLGATAFITYYNKVWAFLTQSEALSGLHTNTLRNTLSSQTRAFASKFHAREMEKLQAMLQTESWSMAQVPLECQRLYSQLLHPTDTAKQEDKQRQQHVATNGDHPSSSSSSTARKKLDVDGEEHAAIGALLLFIKMLAEYCRCLDAMPLAASDLLRKLFEILRSFNSQVRRLILQAEAMRTLGLKRITAKHIALSAEAIAVILAVLPSIKQRSAKLVRDRSKSMLSEFNSVQDEYARHQHDLLSKLTVIMEDVWSACEQDMAWQKAAVTNGCKTFTSSAQKLHKALLPILPPATLQVVFANVMRMLNEKLTAVCKKHDTEKDKPAFVGVAADVLHMEKHLGTLSSMPIFLLRQGLSEAGVVLPPLVDTIAQDA
ncbi:hypothetical protein PTSG_04972 [Salpingoeca rosetta]|uniref:Vacuolar protein sorting-associated protein 54 n=1 Tax=Salpingoeca rosetta (strain ATCC 50818 / BSB-021) TaxID=946362 RepID=F2U956_SALR5|nr:uncharacterized protein PTSG_04972 [Salpingoeca rosetta]EGD73259.1 hypothetical protein PTSG_04972 [Salpingoeca rosetta]|eukprot:XP_004994290.1 hypothetical protein PTSG_04972 [Salpingoeca rosetta]